MAATPFAPRALATWRLHLLRAMYLLIVVGLGLLVWPQFFHRTHPWALMDGVVACMLLAFSSLSLLGLRYPLQMLPLLLWEMTWKAVWLGAIAWPQWSSGRMDDATRANVFPCALVAILFLAVPWDYVLDHYVRKQGDRGRPAA